MPDEPVSDEPVSDEPVSDEPGSGEAATGSGDAELAGQRWRDAAARLEYAERHGTPPEEVERLADEVIEARVAMFQAGVSSGWQLPEFLQAALERDRQLLQAWPGGWDDALLGTPPA